MPRARSTPKAIQTRFTTNMRRVGVIARFVSSTTEDIPASLTDGLRADIYRALIVFLHAAFEDFVRSNFPKPNEAMDFYSQGGLTNIVKKLGADPAEFKDLWQPLVAMAKRRTRIVHRADLNDVQHDRAEPWNVVDQWLLAHWNLAVIAFQRRFRKATGRTNLVEDRGRQNVETALRQHLEVGRLLLSLPSLPPEDWVAAAQRIASATTNTADALKLEVGMFLDAEGRPFEGVV